MQYALRPGPGSIHIKLFHSDLEERFEISKCPFPRLLLLVGIPRNISHLRFPDFIAGLQSCGDISKRHCYVAGDAAARTLATLGLLRLSSKKLQLWIEGKKVCLSSANAILFPRPTVGEFRTSPPSCSDLSSAYLTHRSTKTCVSAGGDFLLISLINKTSRIRVIQIGSVLKTRMAKISPITFVVCLLIQCNVYLFRLANCLHCKVLLHNFLKVYSRPTCV